MAVCKFGAKGAQTANKGLEEERLRDERVFLWGEDVRLGGYLPMVGRVARCEQRPLP
ncbi:MAG: hypothetical protein HZB24_11375 [Desulfobacterales bacterium]|nr:hypothetical protein [Desulfobacterales bacterium]